MAGLDIEVKLTGSDKAVAGLRSIEQESGQVAQSFSEAKTATASLSSGLQDLLNKYDPLGAKLRALQADFNDLNKAARGGQIGPQHDTAVDTAYQALNAQIAQTKTLMDTAGTAGVKGFTEIAGAAEKSMFATAGAKRELLVLGHEAMSGNFSRMPGSFAVLAERMDMTAALMSPVTLGLVGIAAAAVGVAVEMLKGAQSLDAFNKSLVLSGNFSGQTRDLMQAMATTIGSDLTVGVGKAREVLSGLAATGKFTGGEMESVGRAVLDFQHLTGASADVAIKKFEGMTESTVEWARKTTEQYHFLTVSQLEHIQSLVEQGNKEQAIIAISEAWHKSMDTSKEKVGLLRKEYEAWGWVLDQIGVKLQDIGKGNSNAENVTESIARENELRGRLARQKALPFSAIGVTESLEADLAAQHAKTIAFIDKANKAEMAAYQKGAEAKTQAAGVAAQAEIARLEKNLRTKDQINADEAKSIKEWADAINAAKIAEGKKAVYTDDQIFELQEKARLKREGAVKATKVTGEYDALFARQEQMAKIAKDLAADLKPLQKAHEDYAKAVEAALAPLENEATKLEQQLQNYGLTRSQIEANTIAKLEEAKATELLNGDLDGTVANLEREIAARQRIAEASAGLEARKATDDAAKHAADEWKKTADKIGDSITEALMRGFEAGKSFAQTLRDTVVNMFKTMVLKPVIQATVMGGLSALGLGGTTSALAGTGSLASAAGSAGNLLSLGQSAYSAYSGGIGAAYGAVAESGFGVAAGLSTAMETGYMAPVFDAAGTLISAGVGEVAGGLTALGATIGAAIPVVGLAIAGVSLLANVFGGEKSPPSSAASVYSSYKNGAYGVTGMDSGIADDFSGASSGPAGAIGKQVSDSLGGLFKSLGKSLDLQYTSSLFTRGDGKQYSAFGGTINGANIGFQIDTSGKVSSAEAIKAATEIAMGKGIANAIAVSDLSAPIKGLFDGLVDSTIVQSMITGLSKVGAASKALDEVWGISVDDVAALASMMNTTKEGMATTLGQIADAAAAQRGQGAILAEAYQNISSVFSAIGGGDLPQNLKAYDAAMKGVDTTVDAGRATFAYMLSLRADFITFRAAIDALKTSASNAIDAFRTPEQSLSLKQATLADLSQSAGIAVPTAGAQLVALFDAIDFTRPTKAGMDLAKALPDIASAFAAVETANKTFVDALAATATKLSETRATLTASFTTPQTLAEAAQSITAAGLFNDATGLAGRSVEQIRAEMRALIAGASQDTLDTLAGLVPAFDQVIQGITDAATAAADKATAIATERSGLQGTLDGLTLTSTQLLNKQRDALDESNRAIFDQINAINAQKAANDQYLATLATARTAASAGVDTAYAALQRAVGAQKTLVDAAYAKQSTALKDSAAASTKVRDALTSLISALTTAVKATTVTSDALTLARREAAQGNLDSALSAAQSGKSLAPFADSITSAIDDLTTPSENLYATFTDYARSQGRANASLIALQSNATAQGSVAEMTLQAITDASDAAEKAYKEQIAQLDQTLSDAKTSIDILRGIDVSILSVAAAIANLDRAESAAAGVPTTAPPAQTATEAWVNTSSGQYYQSGAGAVGTRADAADPYTITGKNGLTTSAKSAIDYVTAALAANDPKGVYDTFKDWGVSLASLDAMMGWPADTAEAWARENGLPTFARGTNDLPEDMTAQIHKGERIIPAADNRLLMERLRNPNDANAALVAEVKALREELRAGQAQIASNTGKTSRLLDRAMPDGDAMSTRVAA